MALVHRRHGLGEPVAEWRHHARHREEGPNAHARRPCRSPMAVRLAHSSILPHLSPRRRRLRRHRARARRLRTRKRHCPAVRDSSGGVLPGVTVEAASPALIEKVRTTVTDGTGQYRLTELRPGQIRPHVHAGRIQNRQADGSRRQRRRRHHDQRRPVGRRAGNDYRDRRNARSSISQSTRRQAVLDNDVIQALPAARGYGALLNAVPALQGGYSPTRRSRRR